MNRIVLILTAGATLAVAGPSLARQDPASYPRASMGTPPAISRSGPMGSNIMESSDGNRREDRARIAAGLIRSGRCDAATRLAKRQHDMPMLSRISEVCSLGKAPGASS